MKSDGYHLIEQFCVYQTRDIIFFNFVNGCILQVLLSLFSLAVEREVKFFVVFVEYKSMNNKKYFIAVFSSEYVWP